VKDFFKGCGKGFNVELPMGEDGRSTGTAFVIFNERAELERAIELDGQYWPGTERWLKIQEGFEKPERKNFGTGVRPEGCDTVFVGNLPFDVEEDQMREIFGTAGTVNSIRFAMAEDGSFKGFGHVQFSDGACTDEAVKLAGTDINGRYIRVDYAPPRDRQSAGGGASGGRGGRGGRGDGGRGGRGDSGRGRGGGRGTPGPPNKSKGNIAVSAGTKMTFDE
jgi:nucleolin